MTDDFNKKRSVYFSHEEVQAELLKLLVVFDSFCREHELIYFACGGTCLGAVRHEGFIPWDDDVDVAMPREDYEKFLSLYQEFPEGYEVVNGRNSSFPFPFTKFVNKHIEVESPGYKNHFRENLWLDIFPFDGAPADDKELARYLRWRDSLLHIAYSTTRNSSTFAKRAVNFVIGQTVGRILPAPKCIALIERQAQKIPWGGDTTTHVGAMAWGPYGFRDRMPKSFFSELIELPFCGHKIMGPKKWDEYLRHVFGKYMELPPEDQRITHGLKAWRV